MKYLFTLFFTILLPHVLLGAGNDFPSDSPLDTIVVVNNYRVQIKSIGAQMFEELSKKNTSVFSQPIEDMDEMKQLLAPDFQFKHYIHTTKSDTIDFGISEICSHNRLRIFLGENEGFMGYYPSERIFTYSGGHGSDMAIYIDTGDDAFNPYYSAMSASKKYLLSGLHSGQDDVIYEVKVYDPSARQYTRLFYLPDVFRSLPNRYYNVSYIFRQCFVGESLYFSIVNLDYMDPEQENPGGFELTILD